MELDFRIIAAHGVLLAAAASIVIMGSLRYNPRLFLRHFPQAVRDAQPPLSPAETAVGRVVAVLLIALFAGVPIWSAAVARPDANRMAVMLHAFFVGMIFNAVDWLVLDELWLGLGQPRWALPPGVTPEQVPWSHWQHLRGFLSGSVLFLAVGALAAWLVPALRP